MKTLTFTKTSLLAVLIGSVLALSVTGCSDDKESTTSTKVAKSSHNPNPFDHSGDVKVTDSEKQKFEHEFAAQCVNRELKNSENKDSDRERFTKPCICIAKFLMKDLTAQEAEKFLVEHENPQSLAIKYENAAYHCLQEKVPPHEPDFSRP
ncbi:MAG: hypothetical protein Q8N96_12270 [Methylovulum sp.]|nr:hypothetical protein [Methylovulum sp.]